MTHTNRLIDEKSPYLQQHAHNPVDWYPWGPEAFEKATRENKPVFLSVGYSTCYWCHVMERESFEDESLATLLNDNFVPIKVDREERPDIDQVYMDAVQSITGRGGWPMSVFLLPDGRPFYGGTYFPPDQFRQVLTRVARMYREERVRLDESAADVAESVASMAGVPKRAAGTEVGERLVRRTLEVLHRSFDAAHGGFGGAPKFPPHGALRLLLHEYRKAHEEGLLQMGTATLDQMALGGIHDHIGGGFHRYATDERWFVPHFEKMLYDNALLSRSYLEFYAVTHDPFYREAAEGIYAWVEREMTSPEGGFYSALDAESEGVEGKFYLWRRDEIISALGEKPGAIFCRVYNVTSEGNYTEEATGKRTDENILYLKQRVGQDLRVLPALRAQLLRARDQRPRPHRDDKVITSWNGLMIASLAYAGRELQEPRYTGMAERAARFVLANLYADGRLLRRWRDGEAKFPGYLDDYAYLADGLLELHETTGDREWLDRARELMEAAIAEFWDDQDGGFFYTGEHSERLFVRPKEALDHPLPSGNGMAALVLLRLARATGEDRYRGYAERTLHALAPWMERAPYGTETLVLATALDVEQKARAGAAQPAHASTPKPHPVTVERRPVSLCGTAWRGGVAPGDRFSVTLDIDIANGWHINSHRPHQDYMVPANLHIASGLPVEVGEIAYPAAHDIELAGEKLSVYEGKVSLSVPFTVAAAAQPGGAELSISLRFQACDNTSCLPPDEIRLKIPLAVSAL